ncbi:MAG TPA: SCP2 sterol-binding domain-containing protein [Burkholderiales bacterium]|nr:SCP2 sterol-binding domain-containing protein [Burkholderiales bacterium]
MFEPLALPALNRLLRRNSWALDSLRPHAGKTAWVNCAPFTGRFTILETGELTPALPHALADVTITVTPGLLLRTALRDETAWSAAKIEGDVELAAAINHVRRNLVWDYEEDLSRVFGDVAAHRMAAAAQQFELWGRNTLTHLGQAAAEYATFEQPVLAHRHAVDDFNRAVDRVRDDVARLEKRIEFLKPRLQT